jgi:hypothetical protein
VSAVTGSTSTSTSSSVRCADAASVGCGDDSNLGARDATDTHYHSNKKRFKREQDGEGN